MSSKYIIGLDLGKTGGIVVLMGSKIVHKEVMPIMGEDPDVKRIAKIFNAYNKKGAHLVFEKFAGFFGYSKSAAVSMANQSGLIEATAILVGIPYTMIMPPQWQKVVWEGTTIQYKGSKKDTKKTSLITANRLFPQESFLATPRSKKPHEGLFDAALLAVYGQRKGL